LIASALDSALIWPVCKYFGQAISEKQRFIGLKAPPTALAVKNLLPFASAA